MIPSLTASQIEQAFGLQDITLAFVAGVPHIVDGDAVTNQRLARCWKAGTLTPQAEAYQVRAFLIRKGIDLHTVPGLITSMTADGPDREEALMRWEFVTTFPKSHLLVMAVAAALDLDLDAVWDTILAIE